MFPVLKNVASDNNNEELVTFAKTIDFTELFEHVRAFAGVGCEFHQPEITTNRGNVYISCMSSDIAAFCGPFAAILERCYFYSFSNGVFKDKETGKPGYWVSLNIRYEHKDGGSNGMDVVRAWYKNGAWEFANAGERR